MSDGNFSKDTMNFRGAKITVEPVFKVGRGALDMSLGGWAIVRLCAWGNDRSFPLWEMDA